MRKETQSVLFFTILIFLLSPSINSLTTKLVKTNETNETNKTNANLRTNIDIHHSSIINNPEALKHNLQSNKTENKSNTTNKSNSKNALRLKKKALTTTNLAQQNGSIIAPESKTTHTQNPTPKTITPSTPAPPTPESVGSAVHINCNSSNCIPPHGTCMDAHTCVCLSGYANFTPLGQPKSNIYCNYERKNQMTAFILEMLFPFGVGHLYLGDTGYGLAKMSVVLIVPLFLGILLYCCGLKGDTEGECSCCGTIVMALLCLLVFAGVIWQIVDLIMLVMNNFNDGNGIQPKPW